MKGSRFSEEQIIVVLREHEAGIANARALAKMYAACIGEIDGVRLLTHETMERARESQNEGLGAPASLMPLVGPGPQRFGLGFELPRAIEPVVRFRKVLS